MFRKYFCLSFLFALTGCTSVPETQRDMFAMINPPETCSFIDNGICIKNAPAGYATQIQDIRTFINSIPIHDDGSEEARIAEEHTRKTGEILPLPKPAPGPKRYLDAPVIFVDFAYRYGDKTMIKVITSHLRWLENIESIDGIEEHFYLASSAAGYEILDQAVTLICVG